MVRVHESRLAVGRQLRRSIDASRPCHRARDRLAQQVSLGSLLKQLGQRHPLVVIGFLPLVEVSQRQPHRKNRWPPQGSHQLKLLHHAAGHDRKSPWLVAFRPVHVAVRSMAATTNGCAPSSSRRTPSPSEYAAYRNFGRLAAYLARSVRGPTYVSSSKRRNHVRMSLAVKI